MAIADDVEAILARRNPAAARRARQAAARAAVAAREGRAGLAIPEAPLGGRFNGQAILNPSTAGQGAGMGEQLAIGQGVGGGGLGPVTPGQVQQIGPAVQAAQAAGPIEATYLPSSSRAIYAGNRGGAESMFADGTPRVAATSAESAAASTGRMEAALARQAAAAQGTAGSAVRSAGSSIVKTAAEDAAGAIKPTVELFDQNAGLADEAGKLGGFKRALAFQPRTLLGAAPLESGGGAMAAGGLGRAAGYLGAGYLGANVLHGIVGEKDGTWDDAAEGALKGAGAGAAVGSFIGPWGTAIGAGLGGIGGGLWGYFNGNDTPGTEAHQYLFGSDGKGGQLDALRTTFAKYGLSDQTQSDLLLQLETLGGQVGSRDEAKQLVTSVLQSLPTLAAQDKQQAAVQARSAAIQSYLQPMIQSQLDNYNTAASEAAALTRSAAKTAGDPALAAAYEAHAANMLAGSRQAGLGYLTQIAVAPQLYGGQQATDPSLYAGANAQLSALSPYTPQQ